MKKFTWVLLASVLLTGCGGPSDVAPNGASENGGEKSYVIAVIPKGLSHQFWLTVKAGAEAAAAEHGAQIVWKGPAEETQISQQISIIEDMMARNVDAIVMAACHEEALIPVIQKAMDRGIPVVTIDSGVNSDLPVCFVATDNVAGAARGADELAKLIGESGDVGVIPFIVGAATSQKRVQGFHEGIANYPDIQVVFEQPCDSNVAKAMDVTEDMMSSRPDVKGIFAANEPAAIGAAQALRAAGKAGEIKLVAFDAAEQEIAALSEGVIQALIVQNPFRMGHDGVEAAIKHLDGEEVPKRIDTGVVVVTQENLNDPEVQKLLNPI